MFAHFFHTILKFNLTQSVTSRTQKENDSSHLFDTELRGDIGKWCWYFDGESPLKMKEHCVLPNLPVTARFTSIDSKQLLAFLSVRSKVGLMKVNVRNDYVKSLHKGQSLNLLCENTHERWSRALVNDKLAF